MDIILKNYFNKFIEEQSLDERNFAKNFEKFINHIFLSSLNINGFDLMSACVGNGDDAGIDGVAIAVNNRYINNMSELTTFINTGMDFSVEFFFIQTKTSESFSTNEIGNFGDGVADMFRNRDTVKKKMNHNIEEKYNMIQEILKSFEYISSIKINLFYVTPGKYVEDDNHKSTINRIKETLFALDIFDDDNINIRMYDKNDIRKQYKASRRQNMATFELKNKIEIPYIEDVDESYFAVIPIVEYLKIVVDENGRLRRGIFELNVRDFAGIEDNRVNQDIEDTLHSSNSEAFGLLNNGITMVGKSLSKGKGVYTIKNFYIVNGCQTTNVLYKNRALITNDMWISIKIVITQNDKIIKKIVTATNNQTEVQELQLLSMDSYQEELESFYNSYNVYKQLYYERRDGQYRDQPDLEASAIINPEIQMKSFASIFLKSPHLASRFVGKLQDDISKNIFVKDHRPIMYYVSGVLNNLLEIEFNNERIPSIYYKFKFHIEMVIAYIVWRGMKIQPFNSHKMDELCEVLLKQICDRDELLSLIEMALNTLDKVIGDLSNNESNKFGSITNELLLYVELQLTKEDINSLDIYISQINEYLKPFKAMAQSDGDLRYNYELNLEYLKTFIMNKPMVDALLPNGFWENIPTRLNEKDRYIRKNVSENLIEVIEEKINEPINKKLNMAKKYNLNIIKI